MTRTRVAVLGAVVLAGCSSRVTTLNFATPPATSPAPATTKAPDLTGVSLAGVAGQPAGKVNVGPGPATISGTVVGPAGPVGGAVVEAERLVGDAAGIADVTAKPDGTWSLPGILGGRYRVRAWRPPDLAQTTPEIFFLNRSDTKSLTLLLQLFNATTVTAAIAPNPPVAGDPATLAVQLTTQTVDAKGVVRAQPVPGASVQLAGGGTWTTADPNPAATGTDGTVSWQVVCTQPGPQPLTVLVNSTDSYPINLPACGVPPTTTVPSSTSTTLTPQTSTTR